MQYLTVRESVRRMRRAGLTAPVRTLEAWIREQKLRDVWVVGKHTYIYEAELDALIGSGPA